jgi:hypothetical protein
LSLAKELIVAVVIQEFEVTPAANPAPAATAPAPIAAAPQPPSPAEAQRAAVERRERALRLFAH